MSCLWRAIFEIPKLQKWSGAEIFLHWLFPASFPVPAPPPSTYSQSWSKCGTARLPLRAPDPSEQSLNPHSELQIPIGTAGSRSDWALPDLNRELQIPMGAAGSQPRLPDRSRHYWTKTATSRSQWALPDLNSKNTRKDMKQNYLPKNK